MRAGQLRQRVTFRQKNATQDGFGAVEKQPYTTIATVWAAVEPLIGREYLESKKEQGEVTTKIRIRYRTDLTSKMQATYGDHTCEIVSILPVKENKREILIMCKEIL